MELFGSVAEIQEWESHRDRSVALARASGFVFLPQGFGEPDRKLNAGLKPDMSVFSGLQLHSMT